MPIIDLGYRRWAGARSVRPLRWLAISSTSLHLVWRAPWLRRLLMLAWLPSIPVGLSFFAYEQSLQNFEWRQLLAGVFTNMFNRPDISARIMADPLEARHDIWAMLLLAFFRYPQSLNMVVLFGMVAPRIISYDLRSRAYLLYFSRPLSVTEYMLGKAMVLIVLLAMTCTVPALGVYAIGLALSPDTSTILQTWDMPLRIVAASATLAIPTAALAILYSAFTTESRYAAFAWFTTWALGWVAYGTLTSSELAAAGPAILIDDRVRLVSPYHVLGEIQAAVFGALPTGSDPLSAILLVSVVTIAAVIVSHYRIASQLRV
ncbi:hypothetical protein [Candidatus Laterigemmans baculatus]|uniref:hypothetical protein n=1 Tax=Candidatus Laterigemmans baculatus TaxID=2770505 RepID=UPI0013DD590B|nr:hypothetical protein [Candidatus Laterigemmans baculatus]